MYDSVMLLMLVNHTTAYLRDAFSCYYVMTAVGLSPLDFQTKTFASEHPELKLKLVTLVYFQRAYGGCVVINPTLTTIKGFGYIKVTFIIVIFKILTNVFTVPSSGHNKKQLRAHLNFNVSSMHIPCI